MSSRFIVNSQLLFLKKFWIIIFAVANLNLLFSQPDSLNTHTTVSLKISTLDFQNSKKVVLDFIQKHDIKIVMQKENRTNLNINFISNQTEFEEFEAISNKLGFTMSKDIVSNNNYPQIQEKRKELNYLREKNESYSVYRSKIDENDENYSQVWKEQLDIEEKIFNLDQEISKLNKSGNTFDINLFLMDESTVPEKTGVSFVNMPGIEYSMLNIDQPVSNVSSSQYNGYILKYLFTRGKSYFTVGAYKALNKTAVDSNIYSDLFILGFGQDFYSRYFGKGSNHFLNLYSGYTIGYLMGTGADKSINMFYVSPSIGLELYKNKYILIDTKATYFVPLKYTRNLRGYTLNTSFNFAF